LGDQKKANGTSELFIKEPSKLVDSIYLSFLLNFYLTFKMACPSFFLTPSARTPKFESLLAGVDLLISQYLRDEDNFSLDKTRRYVAGHLCQEMNSQFIDTFSPPKKTQYTSWTVFLKQEYKKYADERKSRNEKVDNIGRMQKLFKPKYKEMKAQNNIEYQHLESQANDLNKQMPGDMQIRKTFFDRDLKKLKKGLSYMHNNYQTHFILAYVNNTTRDLMFPSAIINSGGMGIINKI
jgi:hypothetical protein